MNERAAAASHIDRRANACVTPPRDLERRDASRLRATLTRGPSAARLVLGLLLGASTLACAGSRDDTQRAREALLREDHSAPASAGQPSAPARPSSALPFGERDAGVESTTQRILNGVAASRGLKVTGDVHVGKASRPDLLAFIQKEIHRQIPDSHFEQLGRLQMAFGIMPLGADPESVLMSMFAEGVQGLYDPASKSFLIGDDVPTGMREMVVGHEIVHALQDMHFDLEKMQEPMIGHSDRETARTFVIEGDAQASYYAWAAREQGLSALTPELLGDIADQALGIDQRSSQHPFLARLTMMPYTEGAATVVALAKERGWTSVDELFRDLPTTTEQMLHLDKLLAREPAAEIRLPTAAFKDAVPGLRAVYEDDLGEAFLLALMSALHGPDNARRFAAGWGGDRFCVLEESGAAPSYARASVIAGAVHFDSERDATEAVAALEQSLRALAPSGAITTRHKSTVLYVLNASQLPSQADALMDALSRGVTVDGKLLKRGSQR